MVLDRFWPGSDGSGPVLLVLEGLVIGAADRSRTRTENEPEEENRNRWNL